ncbi:helix-turn-helix transcriptional regulator [Williamsia sp. 1138]|uniref:response regulator transcription factor n=1 Tax=Williamsia sp. 1138 TaxID=1903117 RepID=UPI000A112D2A|nr:response regulator transcription factor [Williamsia sp. 1138]OZG26393.1 helix-turn-helix transcriptional regulator [Williamsia sp. 1138]
MSGRGILRVGVIDDHESVVEGLRTIIEEGDNMTFVGGAETVEQLLQKVDRMDLAVLDLRLADGSSPHSNVTRLRKARIESLVYTSGDEPFLVREAAAAGVLGVIRKSARKAEIQEAIRVAGSGRQVASVDWAAALDSDPGFVDLSPRLRQVLELYASGEPTARVAKETGLSADTVSDYVDRIRRKYRDAGRPAPTKTDLYKRAIEDGWLPLPRRFRR